MNRHETKAIPVEGRHLCGLAWLDGLLWYSDGALDQIMAIDPDSGEVVRRVTCRGVRCGLQATADGLWMGYKDPPVLDLRRHGDHEPIVSLPVHDDVADLTVMRDLVVFASHLGGRLNVVDPRIGRIVEVIDVPGSPTGLTWDGTHLWYCDYPTSHLRAVEMTTVAEEVTA